MAGVHITFNLKYSSIYLYILPIQSRQSAKLSLQSSELGLSVSHPLLRRRVCPPPLVPGGHSRLRERGWGSLSSDEGTNNMVL
jgi:hypothetical protein